MSIKHMYYRLYQGVFRVAVNFLDWTPPKIISGVHCQIMRHIKTCGTPLPYFFALSSVRAMTSAVTSGRAPS